jgi:hypothetical protein
MPSQPAGNRAVAALRCLVNLKGIGFNLFFFKFKIQLNLTTRWVEIHNGYIRLLRIQNSGMFEIYEILKMGIKFMG